MTDPQRILATALNFNERANRINPDVFSSGIVNSYAGLRNATSSYSGKWGNNLSKFIDAVKLNESPTTQFSKQMQRLQSRPVKAVKQYLKSKSVRDPYSIYIDSLNELIQGSPKPRCSYVDVKQKSRNPNSNLIASRHDIDLSIPIWGSYLTSLNESRKAIQTRLNDFRLPEIEFYARNIIEEFDRNRDHNFISSYFANRKRTAEFKFKLNEHISISNELYRETENVQNKKFKRLFAATNLKLEQALSTIEEAVDPLEFNEVISGLHSWLNDDVRSFNRLLRSAKNYLLIVKRDIRQFFRCVVNIYFKVLSDFSGCEEEEIANGHRSNFLPKSLQTLKNVKYKKSHFGYRFVHCIYRSQIIRR